MSSVERDMAVTLYRNFVIRYEYVPATYDPKITGYHVEAFDEWFFHKQGALDRIDQFYNAGTLRRSVGDRADD